MRLFFALTFPRDTQAAIAEATRAMVAAAPSMSWVAPERLHLTLKFLGEVEQARVPGLAAVAEAAVNPVTPHRVHLGGVGAFPNLRRPRVVWLGMQDAEGVASIAQGLDHGAAAIGFAAEARPFRPHCTLARVKGSVPPAELAGFEQQRRLVALDLSVEVLEIALMRSTLGAGGPRYDVVERFRMGGR